jgi:hypothetical protein
MTMKRSLFWVLYILFAVLCGIVLTWLLSGTQVWWPHILLTLVLVSGAPLAGRLVNVTDVWGDSSSTGRHRQ